jgi:hypothetical protein
MLLFHAIVEIGGVPEAAPVLGVSAQTVKSLCTTFKKTATKRQADLVKLVATYSGRPRSERAVPPHRSDDGISWRAISDVIWHPMLNISSTNSSFTARCAATAMTPFKVQRKGLRLLGRSGTVLAL